MDKKLIQKYGEEILCYRLRTARQKKRMLYEDFDKKLIQLHKEENALYRQKWNLGWEPLIPPFQRGWKRYFVLRDDVSRSRHAAFFEGILKKINTNDWSHRKDFMVKKRRCGRKKYVVKGQKLLQPEEHHFLKLDFNETEKQMFHIEEHFENRWAKPVKRYVFNEPWRFVLRVRPNMIDKRRKTDAELEARLQKIRNWLDQNYHRARQMKLLYGNDKWGWWKDLEKPGELNPFKNKPLCVILNELE